MVLAGEFAKLRDLLDAERGEHGALRDAVRVISDGLGVVQGEGSSSPTALVLGMYRRTREIAVDALHTGVRRAFTVFGSHYSGINFAGMSGGYAAGYSEAELDEIDASVFTPPRWRPWRSSWRMKLSLPKIPRRANCIGLAPKL